MDCIRFDIASFSCYDFSSWCKNTSGGIATNCFFFAKSYRLFTVYCSTNNHFNCIFFQLIGVLFYATTNENVFRTWAKCIL